MGETIKTLQIAEATSSAATYIQQMNTIKSYTDISVY